MIPIRKGDGTGLSVPGFSEVRKGDGTVLWSSGADIPDSDIYLHDDWGDGKLQNRDGSGTTTTNGVEGTYRPEWTIQRGTPTVDNQQLKYENQEVLYTTLNLDLSSTVVWEFNGIDLTNTDLGGQEVGSMPLLAEGTTIASGNWAPNSSYYLQVGGDGSGAYRYRIAKFDPNGNYSFIVELNAGGPATADVIVTREPDGTWELIVNGSSQGTATDTDFTNPQFAVFAGRDEVALFDALLNEIKIRPQGQATVFDNVTSLSFQQSFDLTGTTTSSGYGVHVRDDGSQMWLADRDNGIRIAEFGLSTAWNVSTASFTQATSFAQDDQPIGVTVADSGTKLYVAALNGFIYEYDLSTAYDITTKTLVNSYEVTYLSEIHPLNIEFYDGGSSALIGMGIEDDIVQFSLSTPYDTKTLSQVTTYDPQQDITGDKLSDVKLRNSAEDMFVSWGGEGSTNDLIGHYKLTTPGDLDTATIQGTKDVSAQVGECQGVAIKPDGTRAFVANSVVPEIAEFRT